MELFDIDELEKIKGYTIMPNYHQRDNTITLKAKGLLSQIPEKKKRTMCLFTKYANLSNPTKLHRKKQIK